MDLSLDTNKIELLIKPELLNVLGENNELLKIKANQFYFTDITYDSHKIMRDLIYTMKYHKLNCLSSVQCGINISCFVFGIDEQIICFNPEILYQSENIIKLLESSPNHYGLFLNIKRPSSLTIKYQDVNGFEKEATYAGLTARYIFNAIDSLNGISIVDKVSKLSLARSYKERDKKIKEYIRNNIKKVKI